MCSLAHDSASSSNLLLAELQEPKVNDAIDHVLRVECDKCIACQNQEKKMGVVSVSEKNIANRAGEIGNERDGLWFLNNIHV